MKEEQVRIWSIEHGRWWKPNRQGYTRLIEEAGIYGKSEADDIVIRANRFKYPNTPPNEAIVPIDPEGNIKVEDCEDQDS